MIFNFSTGKLERMPLVGGIATRQVEQIVEILNRTTQHYRCAEIFSSYRVEADRPPGYIDIRGVQFGDDDTSFAYFPAGVLLTEERPRFREEMMGNKAFRMMIAHVRSELQQIGLDIVLTQ